MAAARRERLILEKLWEAARDARKAYSGHAVMIAALFEGRDPDVLLTEAICSLPMYIVAGFVPKAASI